MRTKNPMKKQRNLKILLSIRLALRRLIVEPHSDTVHIRVIDEIESIDIRTAQAEDTETADLIRFLSSGETPSEATPQEIENLAALATKLIVENGILYFKDPQYRPRLFIPSSLRSLVFEAFHNSKLGGGHLSFRKTLSKCARYFWPKMHRDIVNLVKSCMTCQLRNSPSLTTKQKCPRATPFSPE
jgi:hypothetical protein